MALKVSFSAAAEKAFGTIDRPAQRRIQKFIGTRLETTQDPRRVGEAYTGPLKGYWKYGVGDYRLICEIQDKAVRLAGTNFSSC